MKKPRKANLKLSRDLVERSVFTETAEEQPDGSAGAATEPGPAPSVRIVGSVERSANAVFDLEDELYVHLNKQRFDSSFQQIQQNKSAETAVGTDTGYGPVKSKHSVFTDIVKPKDRVKHSAFDKSEQDIKKELLVLFDQFRYYSTEALWRKTTLPKAKMLEVLRKIAEQVPPANSFEKDL